MFTVVLSVTAIGMIWVLAAGSEAPGAAAAARPGPHAVVSTKHDWVDSKRTRPVPAKIYAPRDGKGPFPVIVFSHGLGGSRDGYEYLGRHWASYGYVSVHVQHKGTDSGLWMDAKDAVTAMRQAVADPRHAVDRPLDVHFAIDQLEKLNRDGGSVLMARLDLDRLGVAGHSYGAYTALVAAGRVLVGPDGRTLDLRDRRIRACVAMSSPSGDADAVRKSYETFVVPCLHMTGTDDKSPIGLTTVAQRRVPFDCIDKADQYLIIFAGGDHMVFSGTRRRGAGANDPVIHSLILVSSTAFWDAYLKGEARAKAWLAQGDFERLLGKNGTFEKKQRR
jgi:predicted dienelactone hydrolase